VDLKLLCWVKVGLFCVFIELERRRGVENGNGSKNVV
jgi:hypothetical protein